MRMEPKKMNGDNKKLVPLGRFELPTSRLLSARSDQLSYRGRPLEGRSVESPGIDPGASRMLSERSAI